MTPVLASGPPSSLARMRLRLGPSTLRSTPMNWTLNSSMWSPSNTVRPTPIIPGRISSTGMRVGDADTVRMDNAASAKARTAGRQCMGKGPQLCRLVVGGLDNDYSGPRARGPAAANLRLDSLPEGLVAFSNFFTVTSILSPMPATVLTPADLHRPAGVSGAGAYEGWWWFYTNRSEGAPLG